MVKRIRGEVRKSKDFRIRMEPDRHASIASKAAIVGLPMGEFMTRAAEGIDIEEKEDSAPSYNEETLLKALRYMNSTANNINQLTHRLHIDRKGGVVTERTYMEILENLSFIKHLMHKAFE